MFSTSRRTLAVLSAAFVLAVALAQQVANPPSAQAAWGVCTYWKIPNQFIIGHSNGWAVNTNYKTGPLTWNVTLSHPGVSEKMSGTLALRRFDVDGIWPRVEFTVTNHRSWVTGLYKGYIDQYGFLRGWTSPYPSGSTVAEWWSREPMPCA